MAWVELGERNALRRLERLAITIRAAQNAEAADFQKYITNLQQES